LYLCDVCPKSFCTRCITNNFGSVEIERIIAQGDQWACFVCSPEIIHDLIQKTEEWQNFITSKSSHKGSSSSSSRPSAVRVSKNSSSSSSSSSNVVCFDLSKGRETFEIPVINDVDNAEAPLDFVYVTQPVFNGGAKSTNNPEFLICCECTDNCRSGNCRCAQESSGLAYDIEGRLISERQTGIYECNYKCACNIKRCKNRVVGRGPQARLELFRCSDPMKGWGVRCKTDLAAGTFVADYIGEIIPESQVEKRGLEKCDQYLFNIDVYGRSCSCHELSRLGLKKPLEEIPKEYIVDTSVLDEKSLEKYFDPEFINKLSEKGVIKRAQETAMDLSVLEKRKKPEEFVSSWLDEKLKKRKKAWTQGTAVIVDRSIVDAEKKGLAHTIDAR
jgi:hypothetical protein